MSRRFVDAIWIRNRMDAKDDRFSREARRQQKLTRCGLSAGHAGAHLWIHSALPILLGECPEVPEKA